MLIDPAMPNRLERTVPAGTGAIATRAGAGRTVADHPRGRGRRRALAPGQDDSRTIPAGAGATPRRARWRPSSSDHPRGLGSDSTMQASGSVSSGPSPRRRGRRHGLRDDGGVDRTIPAGAGAILSPLRRSSGAADHPRRRGDDGAAVGDTLTFTGPSPRARGRPAAQNQERHGERTIPAGAGTTPNRYRCRSSWTDPQGQLQPGPDVDEQARTIPAGAGATTTNTRGASTDHPRGRGDDIFSSSATNLAIRPSLPALELRCRRRTRQPDQDAQTPDVRPGRLSSPPQARPALHMSGHIIKEPKAFREPFKELSPSGVGLGFSHRPEQVDQIAPLVARQCAD